MKMNHEDKVKHAWDNMMSDSNAASEQLGVSINQNFPRSQKVSFRAIMNETSWSNDELTITFKITETVVIEAVTDDQQLHWIGRLSEEDAAVFLNESRVSEVVENATIQLYLDGKVKRKVAFMRAVENDIIYHKVTRLNPDPVLKLNPTSYELYIKARSLYQRDQQQLKMLTCINKITVDMMNDIGWG